ncbi:hypothetical protein ABI59_06585 [Acidobacteria bacterium Mor1]|nr:hypothetical protein ABI59_06585 [Acidobacteria bacterium Mor1]
MLSWRTLFRRSLIIGIGSLLITSASAEERKKEKTRNWFGGFEVRSLQTAVPDDTAFRIDDPSFGVEVEQSIPFDRGRHTGYRAFFGFENPDGRGVRFRFQNLNTHASSHRSLAAGETFLPFGGSTGFDPAFPIAGPDRMVASSSVDSFAFDAEAFVKKRFDNIEATFFAGVRYGILEQSQWALLSDAGISASMEQDFRGWGPTLGAEVRVPFGDGRWAFYGGTRASYLTGDSHSNGLLLDGQTLTALDGFRRPDRNRSVLVQEANLGLELDTAKLRYRLGYEIENWNNSGFSPDGSGNTSFSGLAFSVIFK